MMSPRIASTVVNNTRAGAAFIDTQLLMMILRGQFPSKGWRLAVWERAYLGGFGVELTTRPIPPGDSAPSGVSYVLCPQAHS